MCPKLVSFELVSQNQSHLTSLASLCFPRSTKPPTEKAKKVLEAPKLQSKPHMAATLVGRPPRAAMPPTADRGLARRRQRRRPPPRTLAPPSATPSSPPGAGGTSFPPYEVVSKTEDYDLRLYASHFAVECEYVRRDEGFEKVGSYASGANEAGARFAESQPVVMHFPPGTAAAVSSPSSPSSEPKVMSLHIGPRLSEKRSGKEKESSEETPPPTPPLPMREGVRLAARGGELVAAARVPAQYATPEATLEARDALALALERDGLRLCERDARGAFRLAQYGALFQLEERVNEVQLRVEL